VTIENAELRVTVDRFRAAAAAMAAFLPPEFLTLAAEMPEPGPDDDDAYFGPTPAGFPDDPLAVDAQVEAELQER